MTPFGRVQIVNIKLSVTKAKCDGWGFGEKVHAIKAHRLRCNVDLTVVLDVAGRRYYSACHHCGYRLLRLVQVWEQHVHVNLKRKGFVIMNY